MRNILIWCGFLLIIGTLLRLDHQKKRKKVEGTPLSAFIPCYNDGATIETTLKSLYASYPHELLEVFVINDKSTDNPREAQPKLPLPLDQQQGKPREVQILKRNNPLCEPCYPTHYWCRYQNLQSKYRWYAQEKSLKGCRGFLPVQTYQQRIPSSDATYRIHNARIYSGSIQYHECNWYARRLYYGRQKSFSRGRFFLLSSHYRRYGFSIQTQ